MAQSTLKDKLIALEPGSNSVYIRRIARVLPEIEDALDKGVTREVIVKTLQEDGIDITMNGFAKALYRLRKRAREQSETKVSTPRLTEPVPAPTSQATPNQKPFVPNEIRDIARNRPDLAELTRLGREAAAKAKPNKNDKP